MNKEKSPDTAGLISFGGGGEIRTPAPGLPRLMI